jgi:hypothetical protein
MLNISFLPLSSDSFIFPKSDLTSEKSGAMAPFNGRFPDVLTGFPFNVILAITFCSNLVNLLRSGNIFAPNPLKGAET